MFLQSGSSKNQDQNISFNSPYKNIIKNVNINWDAHDSYNEENDFKMSTHNKTKAVSKLGSKCKTVSKRKRQKQKTNLVKDYGVSIRKCVDFDLEHTDLALALSKSLQATEEDNDENHLVNCTQSEENVLSLRTNLKKFGFKTSHLRSSNVKLNTNLRQEHKKQAKFKFITPTLFLRTEEDRNRIIANKVDAILLEQNTNIKDNKQFKTENLYSEKLNQFRYKGNKLFNHVELTNFYVENLCISPKKEKVDRYLRDWKTIPGRDRSPSPKKNVFDTKDICLMENNELVKTTDIFCKDSQNPSILPLLSKTKYSAIIDNLHFETVKRENGDMQDIRSISPDLFESDEESLSLSKMENNCHESSESSENSSRIDFVSRNETKEETYSICLSDSQLENSFNVTEYVMKILNHDCTMSLTNLDNSKNVNPHQPNFSNEQCSKTTNTTSSFNKLIKDQEAGNEFIIGKCLKDGEITSLDLNNVDKSFQNKIPSDIDIEKDTILKTKIESSLYSNNENNSDCYSPIEISSEDEDNLPIISVRKKTKSKNSFLRKLNNCKSLGITSENENNIYEQPKLLQCEDNLVQMAHSRNTSIEAGKQLDNILSNQVKGTYLNNFNKGMSQHNFEYEDNCSISIETPKQQIAIKVDNVTPMINYDDLDSPEIHKELDKFGLKPLKRKRGIEFLKYIYESTHPVLHISNKVSGNSTENGEEIIKKVIENNSNGTCKDRSIEIVGDLISEKGEDVIFERKRSSSKLATCAVPLHIAWFNFISCNPQIKENILLYEPLQLEFLNASLQEQGYKYNIEDLLHFLDKKCINIKRNNNISKGNRW